MFCIDSDILKKRLEYRMSVLIENYCHRVIAPADFDKNLFDALDFDPLDIKFLIIKIENEFQIFFWNEDLVRIKTISDIVNLIIEKKYPDLAE